MGKRALETTEPASNVLMNENFIENAKDYEDMLGAGAMKYPKGTRGTSGHPWTSLSEVGQETTNSTTMTSIDEPMEDIPLEDESSASEKYDYDF
jgi:hypothetical protein